MELLCWLSPSVLLLVPMFMSPRRTTPRSSRLSSLVLKEVSTTKLVRFHFASTMVSTSSRVDANNNALLTLLYASIDVYHADKWASQLQNLTHGEPFDVVIDGAGGDGVKAFTQLLRLGGIIVSYGMTVKPKVDYTMAAVLRNIEIRGSTMVSTSRVVVL